MNCKLPYPLLLNEESFVAYPSRAEFVSAMRELMAVICSMRKFGFAMQLGCSRVLMDTCCFGDQTFKTWLFDKKNADADERALQQAYQQMLTRVPKFEEGYAQLSEEAELDLVWQDRVIYLTQDRTIPAFLLSICYQLPTVALPTGDFAASSRVCLTKRLINASADIQDESVELIALSRTRHVDELSQVFESRLVSAVLDGTALLSHGSHFLPDIVFSREARTVLPKENLRAVPIVQSLIELQRRYRDCQYCSGEFWRQYGRLRTYAPDESASTRQCHPGSRTFTWDDGTRECWPHVKLGSGYRIHFCLDDEVQKIYIGYLSDHSLPI